MKLKFIFINLVIIIVGIAATPVVVCSADPAPRKEFIVYTESALNAMDELEAACSSSMGKKEINKVAVKFDAAMKKYDRYSSSWSDSRQGKIVFALMKFRMDVDLLLLDYNKERLDSVYGSSKNARALFVKYKKTN